MSSTRTLDLKKDIGAVGPIISTAPDLGSVDGLTSFERATRQPMMLGLFLPHQEGAWTPSTTPRKTSWQFEYNAGPAVRADEAGFDLVFALATWLGKGGYGGTIKFREHSTSHTSWEPQ